MKLNDELVSTGEDRKIAKGFIGLQGEGGHLEFRNIYIKTLPAAEKK